MMQNFENQILFQQVGGVRLINIAVARYCERIAEDKQNIKYFKGTTKAKKQ